MFQLWDFDVARYLPSGWDSEIREIASKHSKSVILVPTSITSRELDPNLTLETLVVDGAVVAEHLPWFFELYQGIFRELGQRCVSEELTIARDTIQAVNLNIQRGQKMRYECHVDSCFLTGILYATPCQPGTGGELVISLDQNALGPEQIERRSHIVQPETGRLLFFEGSKNPHFVRPLIHGAERISVVMSYFSHSFPEKDRAPDLRRHLYVGKK